MSATRQFIRGSSLLLVGRFVSLFLNFLVQVLTVRYLAKADFGSFAYALGVASLGSNVLLLGMGKAIARFVPMYDEQKDYARAFGCIALATLTIWGLGLVSMLALFVSQGAVARAAHIGAESLSLLLTLCVMAPLDAFDNLLQQLAAVFCSPRAIFLRRQLLGPGARLAAVGVVLAFGGDVYHLALGYAAGSVLGVSLYIVTLVREWRERGLLQHLRPRALRWPARELFGFSLPLLSTDMSVALRGSLMVILLEYFHRPVAVAEFRAVMPVAGLNLVVFQAFSFLFVPMASRMFARGDREGIDDLYWKTSLWIALLTFPVFVVTCLMAPSVTVMLFGQRYARAGTLLAVLAVGHYFNAALGFNAATLRVHGKVRIIVASDILTAILTVALGLALVPSYGALGAAFATTATLILQNVFNQAGLWLAGTGIQPLSWSFVRTYVLVGAASAVLVAAELVFSPPKYALAVLGAIAAIAVIRLARHWVDAKGTFPELLRVPLLRQLLT